MTSGSAPRFLSRIGHFLPGLKAPEHVPGRLARFTKPGVTHITLPISRNCEFESHDVPTRPIAAATNSKILETTDTATITVSMQKSRVNFTGHSLPTTNRRPTVQFSKSTALKTHIRILLCNIKCISRKFDSNFRTDAETHCRFVPSWDGCSPPVPRKFNFRKKFRGRKIFGPRSREIASKSVLVDDA